MSDQEVTLDEFVEDNENGWSEKKLRNLLKKEEAGVWGDEPNDSGVKVLRATNYAKNTIDLNDVAIRDVPESKKDSKRLAEGDIILERSGGSAEQPVGRVLFFDLEGEYYHGNFLRQLRPDATKINPRYLYYILDYDYRRGHTKPLQTNTTNIRNLQYSSYLNQNIPSPPLPEQRKIATVLYTVDRAIAKSEEIRDRIYRVKQGVLQDVLAEGIQDHDLTEAKLGPKSVTFPEKWEITTLGDVSTKMRNGFVGTATPHYSDKDDAVPYLQSFNVRENRVENRKEMEQVNLSFHKDNPKTQIKAGDLLTVQSGHIGTSCVVPPEYDGANCHALIITRVQDDKVNPHFVSQFLNSKIGEDLIKSITVGTTVDHLNVKEFKNMRFPLPPLSEQNSIVSILSDFDKRIQKEEFVTERLQRLKRGLLQDLLSGTVRTTNTNIEVPDKIAQHG